MTSTLVLLAVWPAVFQDAANRDLAALGPEFRAVIAEAAPGVRWFRVHDARSRNIKHSSGVGLSGLDAEGRLVDGRIDYSPPYPSSLDQDTCWIIVSDFWTTIAEDDVPKAVREQFTDVRVASWRKVVRMAKGQGSTLYFAVKDAPFFISDKYYYHEDGSPYRR